MPDMRAVQVGQAFPPPGAVGRLIVTTLPALNFRLVGVTNVLVILATTIHRLEQPKFPPAELVFKINAPLSSAHPTPVVGMEVAFVTRDTSSILLVRVLSTLVAQSSVPIHSPPAQTAFVFVPQDMKNKGIDVFNSPLMPAFPPVVPALELFVIRQPELAIVMPTL